MASQLYHSFHILTRLFCLLFVEIMEIILNVEEDWVQSIKKFKTK